MKKILLVLATCMATIAVPVGQVSAQQTKTVGYVATITYPDGFPFGFPIIYEGPYAVGETYFVDALTNGMRGNEHIELPVTCTDNSNNVVLSATIVPHVGDYTTADQVTLVAPGECTIDLRIYTNRGDYTTINQLVFTVT